MSACEHLLRRIAKDPKLAWYFDPCTESMELLTRDYCKEIDADLEGFRKTYYSTLRFERPTEAA